MTWRATVKDDRGAVVPLVGVIADRQARQRWSTIPYTPAPLTPEQRKRVVIWSAPFFVVLSMAPAVVSFSRWLPDWAKVPLAICVMVAAWVCITFVRRRFAGSAIARQYVRAGLCGSCGYDLKALAPEADGCRVCPECGAAWWVEDGTAVK